MEVTPLLGINRIDIVEPPKSKSAAAVWNVTCASVPASIIHPPEPIDDFPVPMSLPSNALVSMDA